MIFREVARQGSFSLAAETLSYSQPAVSHHVTSLEREIGSQLLERSSRGELHLTRVGTVVLAQSESLLDTALAAEMEIARTIEDCSGRTETSFGTTCGAPIIADALVRYRKTNSGELHVVEGERAEIVAALRAQELDLALIFDDPSDPIPTDSSFLCEQVYDDEMLVVLPEDHPLADRQTIDLSDLAEETWIERSGDTAPWASGEGGTTAWSAMFRRLCADAGFEPRVALCTRNPLTVQRLVVSGIGIALLSELTLAEPHPRVLIRPVEGAPSRRILLASVPGSASARDCMALAKAIRETSRHYLRRRESRLAELARNAAPEPTPAIAAPAP